MRQITGAEENRLLWPEYWPEYRLPEGIEVISENRRACQNLILT